MTVLTYLQALNDIIRGSEPEPAPSLIWCSNCGGSGGTHSAYNDNTCPACDGRGKRPSNWRELMEMRDEED